MKIRAEYLFAVIRGGGEGFQWAQKMRQRDREQQAAFTLRALALTQQATRQQGAERHRLLSELGRTLRTPGFDAESPVGKALQQRYSTLMAGSTGSKESPGAPAAQGGFLTDRRREQTFGALDVQAGALLRQAERTGDAAVAKRFGALAVKLKARPDGFTPEQAAAELDATRERLSALRRAKELAAEVKTAAEWLESYGERRVVKPPFQAEYDALRRGQPMLGATTPEQVAQAEGFLQRVREFRQRDPFGPTRATASADAWRQDKTRSQAYLADDRHRDSVRASKSPADLLASVTAQREHARKAGLPLLGSGEADLEEAPRTITVRRPVTRPGDLGRPGGRVKKGPTTAPGYREEAIPEPGALTKARRLRVAAEYSDTQLRAATLKEALSAYALVMRGPAFKEMAPQARREVLAGANEVREHLGMPGFSEAINALLTDDERRELGIRDARREVAQIAQGLPVARERLGQLLRGWSANGELSGSRVAKVQALANWLRQLEGIAKGMEAKSTPDWWLLDTLNRGYRNLSRELEALSGGQAAAPAAATVDQASRKANTPNSGKPGAPTPPRAGPSQR